MTDFGKICDRFPFFVDGFDLNCERPSRHAMAMDQGYFRSLRKSCDRSLLASQSIDEVICSLENLPSRIASSRGKLPPSEVLRALSWLFKFSC